MKYILLILMINMILFADQPPVINGDSYIEINENDLLLIDYSGSDPDGDNIIFHLGSGIQEGMYINSFSGILNWQTDYSDSGIYNVEVIGSSFNRESTLSDTINLVITVNNVDQPIQFTTTPALGSQITIDEGDSIPFSVDAVDPDGDQLSYEWSVNYTPVSYEDTYIFNTTFSGQNGYNAGSYIVGLNISDGSRNSINLIWEIEVLDYDQEPVVQSILPSNGGDITINEMETIYFSFNGYDPEDKDLTYKYYLDDNLVSNKSNYNFTTDHNSNGNYSLYLEVSDGTNTLEYQWSIVVNDINAPLVVNQILPNSGGSFTIVEGESISFDFDGYDPEGNSLLYNWILNGEIVSLENNYSFTTDFESSGNYTISLKVYNAEELPAQFNWSIEVVEYDNEIIIQSIDPTPGTVNMYEMETYNFSVEAFDPDGNNLNYSWILNGSSYGYQNSVQITPDYSSSGEKELKLVITDNGKSIKTIDWSLNIIDVDAPPKIFPIGTQFGIEGENISFEVNSFEPDNDPVIYYPYIGFVEGMSIDKDSGVFNWKPDYNSEGEYNLSIIGSSEGFSGVVLSDTISFSINITNAIAPIIVNSVTPSVGEFEIDEAENILFNIDAIDPDGGNLIYTYKLNGDTVSTTNSFNFLTNYDMAGLYHIDLRISKGNSMSSQPIDLSWDLTVKNVDRLFQFTSIEPENLNPIEMIEGDSLTFYIEGFDPDNDPFSFRWIYDNTIVGSGNNYKLIADYDSFGDHILKVEILDINQEPTKDLVWNISIENFDREIIINSFTPENSNVTIFESESVNFSVDAVDPDGGEISYTWFVDSIGVSTDSQFSFKTFYLPTDEYYSSGDYSVKVLLKDEGRSTKTLNWNLKVKDKNAPIIVSDISHQEGAININENESIDFYVSAWNPDGYSISYTWLVNNEVVSTDSSYQFQTNYNSSGVDIVKLIISDSSGQEIVYTYNIIIADTVSTIIINSLTPNPGDINVNENGSIDFVVDAISDLGNSLSYRWKMDNNILTTNESYTFNTNFDMAGHYTLILDIFDNTGGDYCAFGWEIEVLDVDREIVVNSFLPNNNNTLEIVESETINFNIDAFDPDGNDLSYSWYLNNNIVETDFQYDFTTNFDMAGVYNLKLIVDDNYQSRSISKKVEQKSSLEIEWEIIVSDSNRTPQILDLSYSNTNFSPINQTINENQTLNFHAEAFDPDGLPLTYKWSIEGNDFFGKNYSFNTYFVEDEEHFTSGVYSLLLTVSDGSRSVHKEWEITVVDVNAPIVINSVTPALGNQTISEGDSIVFKVDAYDIDALPLNYVWTVQDTIASYDSEFKIVTDYFSSSNKRIKLFLTDTPVAGGSAYTESFSWFLMIDNVNQPPQYSFSIDPDTITIIESQNLEFKVSAFDPDSTNLLFNWTLQNVLPVSNDSIYYFETNYNSQGNYDLSLNLKDNQGFDSTFYWNIIVENSDWILDSLSHQVGNINIIEGDSINFYSKFTDPGGETIIYKWYRDGALISSGNSYNFKTDYESSGIREIKLNVSNLSGTKSIEYNWSINIENFDRPPKIDFIPNQQTFESDSLKFTLSANDPDGDLITYSIIDSETGMFLDSNGNFRWIVGEGFAGVYNIDFVASSSPAGKYEKSKSLLNDTLRIPVTVGIKLGSVNLLNLEPTFNNNFSIYENSSQLFKAVLDNYNGVNFEWSLEGNIVSTSNSYEFVTGYYSSGSYSLVLKIESYEHSINKTFNWNVEVINVNQAPEFLDFEPQQLEITVSPNSMVEFYVEGSDPDSSEINYTWYFNNEEISKGNQLEYSFTDSGIIRNEISDGDTINTIEWNVKLGSSTDDNLPVKSTLFGNYPNPFNPVTTINFYLQNSSDIKFKVFNLKGEEVFSKIMKGYPKGYNSIIFDGSKYSSGIYFYRLTFDKLTFTKRMILAK
ncbi:MAG: hypothetical protein CR982_06375 [Candidatus Cloacimonadota bacterium]|nr:MAG: hypothetical protein CR982_06375 [Candidatus Cloacimonadota bacterium]PIE77909.1 MAG: hypothetical protein CSA15_10480 [Candidatus Delongbacteria bacterium]